VHELRDALVRAFDTVMAGDCPDRYLQEVRRVVMNEIAGWLLEPITPPLFVTEEYEG
jgi:hypothetical protein